MLFSPNVNAHRAGDICGIHGSKMRGLIGGIMINKMVPVGSIGYLLGKFKFPRIKLRLTEFEGILGLTVQYR